MKTFKRPKRSKKEIKITEEMVKRIHRMAYTTYETIAGDIQQCRAEMGEPDRDMTREEVVETVCDADYMLTSGRDEEAYMFWLTLSREQSQQVVTDAFPHDYYE